MPKSKTSLLALTTFIAVALPLAAQQIREEMVAMRDGAKLATSIYLPQGEGPWPVVLTRTPYSKDRMYPAKNEAQYLDAGYARVVKDVRGRFKSEGKCRPFADDIEDGYDTIEWAAKQPWSNGKVGMVGPSAMEFCRLSELLTICATESGKTCQERRQDPTVSSSALVG